MRRALVRRSDDGDHVENMMEIRPFNLGFHVSPVTFVHLCVCVGGGKISRVLPPFRLLKNILDVLTNFRCKNNCFVTHTHRPSGISCI